MTVVAGPTTVGLMSTLPRSLADDLRSRDDAALAALLRLRPDLVHPVPHDLTQLAVRATTAPAVARALDALDRWTLQVAEVLAALPDPTTRTAVAAALPGTAVDDVDAALVRLQQRALLWGNDDELHLVRAVREGFGAFPCGLAPAADTARAVGDPDDAQGVRRLLAEAPEQARELLDRLAWGPPRGTVADAERDVSPSTARTPVDWVLAHGLLEAVDPTTVELPREVALVLRDGRFLEQPEPAPPVIDVSARPAREASLVDRTAGQHAFQIVRLVADLLDAWAVAPPGELRSGGLGVRDLTAAARLLDVDEPTAALVVELARAAGLLASDDDVDPAWLPTPAYDTWGEREVAERWAVLASTWLTTTRVPALVGSRDERGSRHNALAPDLDRVAAPDLRRQVLDVVAELPPGVPASVDDVTTLLDHRRPRRASALRAMVVESTLREGELLGVLGLGALASPGRALLGAAGPDRGAPSDRSAPGTATTRRAAATEAAAAAVAPLLPEPVDHVLLQADLTAVAPGVLARPLARELALLADVESTGAATVYRFGESSVRRAFDAGRSAHEVHAFLAAHSSTPVPQPLTYLVDDVARRHGGVRVGMASAYVRCDDDASLTSLLADKRAASLRAFRLAPTVLAVQVPVDEALATLRAMGWTPMAESPDGAVVVRRPDERRTRLRRPPASTAVDAPAPDDRLLSAAVKAMRAGERPARPDDGDAAHADAVPVSAPADTLAALRAAVAEETSLWVGYTDPHGRTSERLLDPVSLDRGVLTAYDHRADEVRTFALHRITGTAPTEVGASGSR